MAPFINTLKKIYHLLPRPPSSNYPSHYQGLTPFDQLPADAVIFDLGAKNTHGVYGPAKPPETAKLVCVDVEPGKGVDLVADIHDLNMVADNSVDLVMCFNVLEHVRYPQKVMKEIFRILKPGGLVSINIPFIFPFHADPNDFYRFSYKGIEILCEDFERVDSGFTRGPASTMHQLLVHFLAMLFCFNNKALYGLNQDLFGWLFFWVKYLDIFLSRYQMAYVIHSASYFVGRKAKTK